MTQHALTLNFDDPGPEFDRFMCRWFGEGPGGYRERYGPACVPLADGLKWCAEHAQGAFLHGFGHRRWSIGEPSEGFPPLPEAPVPVPLSWEEHAVERWEIEVSLNLGIRDYERAAPGFEGSLRARVRDVRSVARDDIGAKLQAVLLVTAPTKRLACDVAAQEARRAATDHPDGLLDEVGEALGVQTR